MLDMVFLHCGPTAVFLKEHPDFVKRDQEGKVITMQWGFPGLNFASEGLREYLWQNMEMWVRDYGVDGFRCDVSDGVPLDFWERGRERLEKIRPDIGMLAEGMRKADQLKAFDLDYSWGEAFRAWNNAAAIRHLWEKMRDERPVGGARFIRFIDNHDFANDDYDNRIEKRWGAARVEAALVCIFTLDGVPFLYNGQEVADTARHSIFGKMPIDWSNGETAAGQARFAFVQKLCALRRSEKTLMRGGLTWLDNDASEAVLSFARELGGVRIVAAINLTGQPVRVKVEGAGDGAFQPLLSARVSGDAPAALALEPYGYWVGKR